jgi:methyl-accepting chemotaxis protein
VGSGRRRAAQAGRRRHNGALRRTDAARTAGLRADAPGGPAAELERLLPRSSRDGEFNVRLPATGTGIAADLNRAFNELADRRHAFSKEVVRVGRAIGREGRLTERAASPGLADDWNDTVQALHTMIDDLVRPTTEVARVIDAVADGDLSQKMQLTIEGQPVKGEFRRISTMVN